MIINQIVSGGGGSLPQKYLEYEVDANGSLKHSTTTSNIMDFSGATYIDSYVLYQAYKNNTAISGALDMSDVERSYSNGCYQAFMGCTGLTSVKMGIDFPFANTNDFTNGFYQTFRDCTGLTSADLSSLTTVDSTSLCYGMFMGCSNLTNVDLSKLGKVGTGCANMFQNCTSLTNINLPRLLYISSNSGCESMFKGCTGLTQVDFNLVKVAGTGCKTMFQDCTNLQKFNFNALMWLNTYANLQNMFQGCTSLTEVNFYALPLCSRDFNNAFSNMLSGVTGCTVHFPMRMSSSMSSYNHVRNGFGGTNTTVLFDIVTSINNGDGVTLDRSQKDNTSSAIAWNLSGVLYYTSGLQEPQVGDTIYSDSACTTAVTTIDSIA